MQPSLNFKDFRKVKDDGKSATLQHPKGHKIVIAKNALSKAMRGELEKLPLHLADGGTADSSDEPNASDAATGQPIAAAAQPVINVNVGGQAQTPSFSQPATPEDMAANNPTVQNVQSTPAPATVAQNFTQPPQASAGQPDASGQERAPASAAPNAAPGYGDQLAGIQQKAAAENTKAQEQANAYKQSADVEKARQTALEQEMGEKLKEVQSVTDDFQKGHIDPNHFLDNQSSGQKIRTAIGLILGGIGGGLLHQENPALKFLNAQIERDLDAQKTNLGKKQNLLTALQEQYRSIPVAENMFRAIRANILGSQIDQAASKAAGPNALANAKIAKGQLLQQYIPIVQKAAALDLANKGSAQPGSNGVDPASLVQYLVPKEHQAAVAKEIGDAQNVAKNKDNFLNQFDQAAKDTRLMTGGSPIYASGLKTSPAIDALKLYAGPLLHDEQGRVNPEAMETFNANLPHRFDSDNEVTAKRKALEDFFDTKAAAPLAKSFGLNLDNFQSTSKSAEAKIAKLPPQQQQYYAYAKANPNDPRSKMVLAKLGVK